MGINLDEFNMLFNYINIPPWNLFVKLKNEYVRLHSKVENLKKVLEPSELSNQLKHLQLEFLEKITKPPFNLERNNESLSYLDIDIEFLKRLISIYEEGTFENLSKDDQIKFSDFWYVLNMDHEDFHSYEIRISDFNKDQNFYFKNFSKENVYAAYRATETFFPYFYASLLWDIIKIPKKDKNKTDEELIWFKVGVLFAKGDPYELREKDPIISFRDMAVHFDLKKSNHSYFSNSFGNNSKNDKNIFSDQDKIQKIKSFCKENGIEPCDQFNNECERFKEK